VACANPRPISPPRPPTATAPKTATPSVSPTWRLVVATAAATPACAAGIPDTAVLAIGGLTSAKPKPNTAYALSRNGTEVPGARPVSIRPLAMTARPPASIDGRVPTRPTRRPERGAKTMSIIAVGSMYKPVCSAESPRTSCR
jgi:hypothetical protein